MLKHLIERKRDGEALGADEWRDLVFQYAGGEVPDYQMAALCMAVYFRGLQPHELQGLTDAMLASGGRLEFSSNNNRVDKHSTGGVGDVLTGMTAAWLAQLGRPDRACQVSVFLHGLAGDLASDEHGEAALIASDLIACLGQAVRDVTEPPAAADA